MKLSDTEKKFIGHWGDLGSRWGVNRTISHIHALMFLADNPLTAGEITDTLELEPIHVVMGLKELQSLGLAEVVVGKPHEEERYKALENVWEIFHIIVEQRRKREIDPTLSVMRECMLTEDRDLPPKRRKKIENVIDFLERLIKWHDDVKHLPRPVVFSVYQMGARIQKLVGKVKEPF